MRAIPSTLPPFSVLSYVTCHETRCGSLIREFQGRERDVESAENFANSRAALVEISE